jgi:hypothetical protein
MIYLSQAELSRLVCIWGEFSSTPRTSRNGTFRNTATALDAP